MIKLHYAECKLKKTDDGWFEGVPEFETTLVHLNQEMADGFVAQAKARIKELGKGYYIHIDIEENGELKDVLKIHPDKIYR